MTMDLPTKPFVTAAECDDVAQMMGRKYTRFMNERYFEATMRRDGRGVYAKVTLRNQSGSYYYPVEGRLAHAEHEMSDRDAAFFLLDYIDSYFDEYFRGDGGVYLPIDWADYEWEGVPLQLKGQILNLEIERMADDLLERGAPVARGDELH
jgi:hypothetical protein